MLINFDTDLLKSLVTMVELGSLSQTGERLGRTESAISLQLCKLQ